MHVLSGAEPVPACRSPRSQDHGARAASPGVGGPSRVPALEAMVIDCALSSAA